jgi:hypothetical protein
MTTVDELLSNSLDRYGERTCFLIQKEHNQKDYYLFFVDINEKSTVNEKHFIKIIPRLISQNYTVVVIIKVKKEKLEIVAVHQPSLSQQSKNSVSKFLI